MTDSQAMLSNGTSSPDPRVSAWAPGARSTPTVIGEGQGGRMILRRARELSARWETIRYLVVSNLKAGHRDKLLGHLWSLLDPLLFIGVYFVVFGLLFRQNSRGGATYIIYLSLGVIVFRFFEGTVLQATYCIKSNRGLIHEIGFPKGVFPLSVCLSRLYDFIWGLVVLVPLMWLAGCPFTIHAVWVIPLLLLNVLTVSGLAFLAAYLGAFFADTANIVGAVMRLLLYLSPTFYYVRGAHSLIPQEYLPLYMVNPIACFLESYRDALLWGRTPDLRVMAYTLAVSVLVLSVGFAIFSRGEGRFAKYV